ncbi:LicD family protein, partial [Clostridium saudiense]|nr:LicD family protein [Clostridium saudiense]
CEYCGEIISEPGNRSIARREVFEGNIIVPFEEITLPIPKEYDEYLSKSYLVIFPSKYFFNLSIPLLGISHFLNFFTKPFGINLKTLALLLVSSG